MLSFSHPVIRPGRLFGIPKTEQMNNKMGIGWNQIIYIWCQVLSHVAVCACRFAIAKWWRVLCANYRFKIAVAELHLAKFRVPQHSQLILWTAFNVYSIRITYYPKWRYFCGYKHLGSTRALSEIMFWATLATGVRNIYSKNIVGITFSARWSGRYGNKW